MDLASARPSARASASVPATLSIQSQYSLSSGDRHGPVMFVTVITYSSSGGSLADGPDALSRVTACLVPMPRGPATVRAVFYRKWGNHSCALLRRTTKLSGRDRRNAVDRLNGRPVFCSGLFGDTTPSDCQPFPTRSYDCSTGSPKRRMRAQWSHMYARIIPSTGNRPSHLRWASARVYSKSA